MCIFFCVTFNAQSQNLQYGDIVITELMVDPDPVLDLPNREYIEIYNNSKSAINLENCILVIGDDERSLDSYSFLPNTYLILCSTTAYEDLKDYGNTIAVKSFGSLNNTGKRIAIMQNNQLIASLNYTDEWYQNPFKEDGGWSLEKENLQNFSETMDNWASSNDRSGGTPGRQNSMNCTDEFSNNQKITNTYFKNDSTLVVSTNCNTRITNIEGLSFSKIQPLNYSLQEFEIALNQKIEPNKEYEINITLGFDEQINFDQNIASFDSLTKPYSVVIQEILFNPNVGESDFVEIKNHSDSYFNLSDIFLAKSDFSSKTVISEKPFILRPNQTVVLSEDIDFWEANSECSESVFLECDLPTLADDSGSLILLNKWGEIIDSVTYFSDWYSDSFDDLDGISLHRIQQNSTETPSLNWAAALASPGCEDSDLKPIEITINPTSLNIEYVSYDTIDEIQISIYNMQGIEIKKSVVFPTSTTGIIAPDYNDVSSGIYVQQITYFIGNRMEKSSELILIKGE